MLVIAEIVSYLLNYLKSLVYVQSHHNENLLLFYNEIHGKICMRNFLTEVIDMLKSFQICNFNSIKDPIVFSMEPVNELTEHLDYITRLDEETELLKVASIYGPNASGKSNLLHALQFVQDFVGGRLSRENPRLRFAYNNSYAPFEFTDKKDNQVKVSLVFSRENREFWYRFTAEYLDEGPAILKIIDEYFAIRTIGEKTYNNVFSRDNNGISANRILEIIGASRLPISNDMALLRHLYVTYIDLEEENKAALPKDVHLDYIRELFDEIRSITLLDRLSDMPSRVFRYNGNIILKNKQFIIESLKRLDIHITDIDVREIGQRDFQVFCIHEVNGIVYELRLEQESQGTSLLIYLLSMIASRRNRPTIFLIDELDSHLHPKLVSEIISLFNSKLNIYNQLIFNSHDMWNMVPEQFRRDQVWFTCRNDQLATELICLSDIVNYKGERIRKDAKYSKQYMEGKYGADPFIRKGLDWNELL